MGRSEIARQKVRDAAAGLLLDAGVPAFTVDEVARRSGVAKTTIYRHWPNVNALLTDAIVCQIEVLPTPNTGTLRGDLQALIDMAIPVDGLEAKSRLLFGLLYAAADDPELRITIDELVEQRTRPIRTIVQLAQGRGEVPADLDPEHAVALIEGPFMYWFVLRSKPIDPTVVEAMLDLVVAGLTSTA